MIVKVCGIAGSLRRGSQNRGLLRAAAELAPERMTIALFDRLGDVPLYNADVEAQGDPEAVPGVLKNAIDWASRPPSGSVLAGKPTALLGASPARTGTARAQLALRLSFVFTQTPVLLGPELLVGEAQTKFAEDGKLSDERTRQSVRALLERLLAWVETNAKR